ncbi:methyl-accepting chemotaxis protein [Clostridium homopropionicum]|nr:methyl-accepting chemotaxis protein [Clostridium homopropionicum]
MLTTSLGNIACEIAKSAAEKIPVEEYKQYKTVEDTNKESYQNLLNEFSDLRKVSGSKYLYVIQKNDQGKYIYILDGSEEAAEFGDEEKPYEDFENVYKGTPFISDEIEIDEYGTLISAYYPIKDSSGSVLGFVGVDYDVSNGYEALNKFRNSIILVSIIVLVLSIIIAIILSKYITKPIEKVSKVAQKISDYDLTVDKVTVDSKDEIGVLAKTFNIMLDSISNLIKEISLSSESLHNTSESLSEMANNTTLATDEVSKSINEIASSTNKQTSFLSDGTEKTNKLADSINEVSSSIQRVTYSVSDLNNLNRQGISTVNLLIDKSKESSSASEEVGNVILEVDKSSHEIGVIVDTINKIAAQTQLLALNASIESARAGEHGKGFAVVAEEVRKLSEQSASATENISKLIEGIQFKSAKAVSSMKRAAEINLEQGKIMNETEVILTSLSNKVKDLINDIQIIKTQNDDMTSKKEAIVLVMNEILKLAEENGYSTEETIAATEELLSSVSEFTSYANNLNTLSEKLIQEVERFKTN